MNKFITFEGIEGSGKSSHIITIRKMLDDRKIPFILTREPGGSRIGDLIRDVLLHPSHTEMDPYAELLLYLASRRQHIVQVIQPALKEGKLVLCDRYEDSSLIYQGYARGIGIDDVVEISRKSGIDLKPDLTILFDVDPETGLERARGRSLEGITRFENELLDFHKKVREGYLLLAGKQPERFRIVDTSKSFEEVKRKVVELLFDTLGMEE